MVDVPFLSYLIPPTGTSGTYARSLPDQLGDVVNVKDHGAVGNGIADDTVAIKAAFAKAWGDPSTPHGATDRFLNKPVYFPAGDYKVTDTIYVRSVDSGWIIGQGSKTTRLIYAGAIPNAYPVTQDKTNLFFTNGFSFVRIEGIAFVMTGGNAPADKTCCFNWNWDNSGGVNTTTIQFFDVGFEGGTYGCLMGDDPPAFAGTWGYECDAATWYDCWVDNCYHGTESVQFNVMNSGWYGGSIKNCSQSGAIGMMFKIATFVIHGVDFSNNDLDIECDFTPMAILNCRSTSSWFCKALASGIVLSGCIHNSASPTNFCGTVSDTQGVSIDDCWTNGALQGQGSFFVQNTHFDNSPWWGGSKICELATTSSFVFADLPPIANAADGLRVSITDSPTATWGATVSTGGGSNHVQLRANATVWTVVGK